MISGERGQQSLVEFLPIQIGAVIGGRVIKGKGNFWLLALSEPPRHTGQYRRDGRTVDELSAIHLSGYPQKDAIISGSEWAGISDHFTLRRFVNG